MSNDLKDKVFSLKEETILIRRDFHQHPELGMEVNRTAKVVAAALNTIGLEVTTEVGKTGVVGLLRGNGPGKTLMLRADMDALPIKEENDVPYRSLHDGVMHACGHDGHMACLLTAAKILNGYSQNFPGQIKFVFQPGEEGFAGARQMIEDGVLENPTVDAAIGFHVSMDVPCGFVETRVGPMLASMDSFIFRIKGKGAHAAEPEGGIDAILMGTQVIDALQSLVTKEISPLTPLVLHVGTIKGGDAFNTMAEEIELKGTVRTLDQSLRKSMPERMNRIARGVTAAFRGSHDLDYTFGYPPLINDKEMTALVEKEAALAVTDDRLKEASLSLVSEDMAFFLERVPGCIFNIGVRNDSKGLNQPLHNSRFDMDEEGLMVGVEVLVRSALAYLGAS